MQNGSQKGAVMDLIVLLTWVFRLMGFYLLIGLGFAFFLILVKRYLERLDPSTRGVGLGFRLLIVPGLTIFWPIFLRRVFHGDEGPPQEKDAHRAVRYP